MIVLPIFFVSMVMVHYLQHRSDILGYLEGILQNLRYSLRFLLVICVLAGFFSPTTLTNASAQISGGNFTQTKGLGDETISLPAQVNLEFTPITIPSGGTSLLSISIYNPNAFALILSNSPAALTNTLPNGVTFASPANASTTCGGTISIIGTTLSLIGGTVPAKVGLVFGTCTITVNVTSIVASTHINTIPENNLKATDPTGTIAITNTTPASNNLLVSALQPPSLSKSFNPNTLYIGQNSQLAITIRNNDLNHSLTNVSLTDNLPANVVIANSTVTSSNCGSPSVTVAPADSSVTINNATILKDSACVVRVNVTSSVAGVYLNTIPARAITSQQFVTNASAASAPINFQSIGATKAFSPGNFEVGGTSTMTITLRNPTDSPYTGVSFTDTLPQGLTIYGTPADSQCGGTVSFNSGSISLENGTIPAGTYTTPGTCTITAQVTSSISASFTNSIPAGGITTNQGAANVSAVTANITVYSDGAGITNPSKSFSPSTIAVGGVSTLTINVRAPADTSLTNFSLTDALPIGVQVAAVPNKSQNSNCQGGTFNPTAGATLLSYSGGTIPAGQQCTLKVDVTSSSTGVHTNRISAANISNNEGRNISSSFSANLTVSGLSVSKAFYPSTVNINGVSTLTITLTNQNYSFLDDVEFTDTLPSGTNIAPTPNLSTTCGSGSVTLNSSTRQIIMDNGVVPARVGSVNGICTVNVDVVGLTTGTKNNSIAAGGVSGNLTSIDTRITNPSAANASLIVNSLSISVVKGFSPIQVFGGSISRLTVTLTNPTTAELTGISFTDNLPQGTGGGVSIANPPQPSVGTCGGTLSAVPGETAFTFSGGYLAPNANCSVSVNVTMNVEANLTNNIAVGAVTTTNGAKNALVAEASLTNLPGASVTKYFVQNPIQVGDTSTLGITIQNQSNFGLTRLGLVDILPAGLSQTGALTASQCNGTVEYDSGTRTISFSGGALAAFESCTLYIDVTATSEGEYQNCIQPNVLVNDQNATNQLACDSLSVEQALLPPQISKNFAPNPIAKNSISALTFTITNPNAVALTGVGFTDTFPTDLYVSSSPNPTQCGGTVTSTLGSITLEGGTVAPSSTCTVTVGVSSDYGGVYDNVSGNVTSTNGGTGNTASRSLTVLSPPVIGKYFSPDTITSGETSTLNISVANPSGNTVPLTGVSFTDTLPTGLMVADPANVYIDPTCGTPTFAPSAGETVLSFTDGTIQSGDNCFVLVDVIAPNAGDYNNITSIVTSTNGGPGNFASALLAVEGFGLSLVKSTTTPNYKAAGDSITYNYLLTNTGTTPLYAPFTVNDDKISGGIDCGDNGAVIELGPNETTTCTADYMVQASDVTAKSVTNTATATAKAINADEEVIDITSNPSSVTVQLAKLTLQKTTGTLGYRSAGDRIDYTYTLTNTGNVTLYAPFEVSDDRFSSGTPFTCGSATVLPPGAVTSCAKSGGSRYTVTADDITAGQVTNTAYATGKDAESDGATVTSNNASVTVYKLVGPNISKAFSPNPIAVGSTTTLTFTITNPNSTTTLTGVGFTDTFPAGMTKVSDPAAAQCGGTVSSTANSITLASGSIIPDGSCTVSILVTASDPDDYLNTSGTVTSTNGGNGNTASSTLTVIGAPDISKAFSPASILENDTSTLTINVVNPASNTAVLNGVAFTDIFPSGLKVQDPPNLSVENCGTPVFNPAANDTSLSFSNGTIAVAGTCVIQVDVTAPSGTYPNTTNPVVSSNGGTGVKSNTATLGVNQAVDLSITKTDGKLAVDKGEESTYTIEVTNAGPSNAVNANVYDTIPTSLTGAAWTCVAETGASCTASGSGNIADTVTIEVGKKIVYTVTATVDNSNTTSVVNTASVVPPAGIVDVDETNNSASDSDTLNSLTIEKSVTQTDYETKGEMIDYSYLITNTGTSTLVAPFDVQDDRAEVICASLPETLAPTETFTCSAQYEVTQSDLDGGSITNRVTATAKDADGDTVTSNEDTKTISGNQRPVIGAAKRVVSVNKVSPGTWDVTFEIVLRNYGNVTLYDIALEDDLKTAFPSPATFTLQSTSTPEPALLTLNPDYDGVTFLNLLGSGNSLDVGQSKKVVLVVRVIPTDSGPYNNSANVYGISPEEVEVNDTSHNGANPDPDNNNDPTDNNDPTPVDFGANMFDPPFGIKTFDDDGMPQLKWTMEWINNSNIVNINARVSDPIPTGTTFNTTGVPSGTGIPSSAPVGSTDDGVSCSAGASTTTTTTWCYYEGPSVTYPLGRIIWEGSLGPDLGITDPALATNKLTITFNLSVPENKREVKNTATIDIDANGNGLIEGESEVEVAVSSETWSNWPDELPLTGFAPGKITDLSGRMVVSYDQSQDFMLEIPALNVNVPILGVPIVHGKWNLDWLGGNAGYLENTAFPTHAGNSGITAHVYDAFGKPGPFINLTSLNWGDEVIIHYGGMRYVYEVREVKRFIDEKNFSVLKSEKFPWVTLITCQGYDAKADTYRWRSAVRAVQIRIEDGR